MCLSELSEHGVIFIVHSSPPSYTAEPELLFFYSRAKLTDTKTIVTKVNFKVSY